MGASKPRPTAPPQVQAPGFSWFLMSGSAKSTDKTERLRQALRENLKRRKAQAKQRAAPAADQGEAAPDPSTRPHDSAGIGADKRNQ